MQHPIIPAGKASTSADSVASLLSGSAADVKPEADAQQAVIKRQEAELQGMIPLDALA